MDQLKIFAPATVANVSCGFDAMGFAVDSLGDEMVFSKNGTGKVTISKVEGANLTTDIYKNAASVVVLEMLKDAAVSFGVDIQICKGYKPGSGLGSSAASSAGAAFAINTFLGNKYTNLELVKFAMLGEEAACGSQIADNVGAALYGGLVLIRSYEPLDIIPLPTPADLYVALIHPQVEIKTEDARNILPKQVPIRDAIAQWANVGGLVSGLYTEDFELIGRSLVDKVAEPSRKVLIPHFDALKASAMEHSAIGAGISGSGPTVFALCQGELVAGNVAQAFHRLYEKTDIPFKTYVSAVGGKGTRII